MGGLSRKKVGGWFGKKVTTPLTWGLTFSPLFLFVSRWTVSENVFRQYSMLLFEDRCKRFSCQRCSSPLLFLLRGFISLGVYQANENEVFCWVRHLQSSSKCMFSAALILHLFAIVKDALLSENLKCWDFPVIFFSSQIEVRLVSICESACGKTGQRTKKKSA